MLLHGVTGFHLMLITSFLAALLFKKKQHFELFIIHSSTGAISECVEHDKLN